MPRPIFSLRAVAALYLERQQLDRPRARRLTAASLVRFAEEVGGIQLDSINVVERAHHLTLWSRFGPYDRATLDRLIYRRRLLFEYWAHGACLISAGQLSAWRRAMLDYRHHHKGWAGFLKHYPTLLRTLEENIRERGPLGNSDFPDTRANKKSGWWSWKPETHALDFLWMSGHLSIHSRLHFQKRFDLLERVLPELVDQGPLTAAAFRRWHLERSLHAMGAATEIDLRMYLTFPRIAAAERAATLRAMIRRGEVVEIEVAGSTWYVLARDLEPLAAAGRRRAPSRGATLLSPFDSFMWHRERIVRLFGYDYRIEVYVPAGQRTFGYYTLPLLVDGQLIGRVDTKLHRAARRLELRHVCFEPWFAAQQAAPRASSGLLSRERGIDGLTVAVRSLAHFTGAEHVDVERVTPSFLRVPVHRALHGYAHQ